jgi:hypothetical protein
MRSEAEPEFVVFSQKGRPARPPRLTINTRGDGYLNASAWEALGNPPAVLILFDEQRRILGFRGCLDGLANAYALRDEGGTGRRLSLKSWARHYGFPLGTLRHYVGRLHADVLAFDLNRPSTEKERRE